MAFFVNVVTHLVVLDIKLAGYTFSFKFSQLQGVLASWFAEDLRVLVPSRGQFVQFFCNSCHQK